MFQRKGYSSMKLIIKILALPFALVTGILYLMCKFLVAISGAVLAIFQKFFLGSIGTVLYSRCVGGLIIF